MNDNKMEKIRIGGIKLSSELILIRHFFPMDGADFSNPPIYRILANQRINIPFLSIRCDKKQVHVCCTAPTDEFLRIKHLLPIGSCDESQMEIFPGKVLLTLFPHKGRLDILGLLLTALKDAGIAVYGFSSSISSLSIVIDLAVQNKVTAAIGESFELPHYHSPFKSKLTFVEKRS